MFSQVKVKYQLLVYRYHTSQRLERLGRVLTSEKAMILDMLFAADCSGSYNVKMANILQKSLILYKLLENFFVIEVTTPQLIPITFGFV